MPEYSNSTVIGYSDNSSDESDDHRSPLPCRYNTRRCQYTNSPKYNRNVASTSAHRCSESSESDHVHCHRHSADSVHVELTNNNAAAPAVGTLDVMVDDAAPEDKVCAPHFVGAVLSSASPAAPFTVPHLIWKCSVEDRLSSFLPQRPIAALLDHGSPVILIRELLVIL